jgi:hypothetical protein
LLAVDIGVGAIPEAVSAKAEAFAEAKASPTPTQPGGFLSCRQRTGGNLPFVGEAFPKGFAPLPDYARQDIAPIPIQIFCVAC